MRIAGAALFIGATASFALACTVPNGQRPAIVTADPVVIQNIDTPPMRIKPEMTKPEGLSTEPAETTLLQS